MKKVVALILASVMILCLCGCQTNPLTGGKDIGGLSADEAVRQAAESLYTADSCRLDLTVSFAISAMGQTVRISENMAVEQTRDPEAAHTTMDMDTGLGQSMTSEAYAVKDGSSYVIYNSTDGGAWTKQVSPAPSTDIFANMKFDHLTGCRTVGTEQLGGETCTHIVSRIAIENLAEVLGNTDAFASFGLDFSDPATLAQFDDLEMHIWISQSTGRLMRYSLDMTAFLSALMQSMAQGTGLEMEISEVVVQCDISKYNEIAPIEVPAEVLQEAG